jgi:hypothetical protein
MSSAPASTPTDWLAEFPPPRSLSLDPEAVRIFEAAYHIGLEVEQAGTPRITFTTLMAALLGGADDTSKWFAETAATIGPIRTKVFAGKRTPTNPTGRLPITEVMLSDALSKLGTPDPLSLSSDNHLLTFSARGVLTGAEEWALRVGGSDIGVRHLVASYVLNPPAQHRGDMAAWDVQDQQWRTMFFEWVARRYTWESWSATSQRPSPARQVPDAEQLPVKAEQLAFPGDKLAQEVLEATARLHAQRTDEWVRMETLFYALLDTARTNTEVQTQIAPIWKAIEAAEQPLSASRAKYFEQKAARAVVKFRDCEISPRVLNTLEAARELAVSTMVPSGHGTLEVSVRHLAGALVSVRVDSDAELTAMGLAPQELRKSLFQDSGLDDFSAEIWRELLGEEETFTAGHPVELNSDEPEAVIRLDEDWASDPLGIRPDVESFASLIASRKLEPPLAIGLFGPWGSGKTTFLKRLRRAVDARAKMSKAVSAGAGRSPFVADVVHVEFNAWHFAEDALISSLVDAIFREFVAYANNQPKIAGIERSERAREALVTSERRLEAAQQKQQEATVRVTDATGNLTVSQNLAAEKLAGLDNVVRTVWQTVRSEFANNPAVKESGVLEAVGESAKSVTELRAEIEAVRSRPARMLSDLGWKRTLIFAGLVLVVPPVLAWVVGNGLKAGGVAQALTSVTAVLTVATLWVRNAARAVTKVNAAVTKVANEYEKKLAGDPTVKAAQRELADAQASATAAGEELQRAQKALSDAKAEVADAAIPAQILQLVTSRVEDKSYGKELTTVSTARTDLEALGTLLREQRDRNASAAAGTRIVERIILYIDDLDRCEPKDVVRVLQLVHMLLTFELFVVVVAVDASWVEESLRRKYTWLASSDGNGTAPGRGDTHRDDATSLISPQDYLEKIFQVSLWMQPMSGSRAARYIGSLVRSPYRSTGPIMRTGVTLGEESAQPPAEASSDAASITGIELDYMKSLANYVGSSPRRVKRLINVYRIIKAGRSAQQIDEFLTRRDDGGIRPGPYQVVIALLVIGTGPPSSASAILKELADADPGDTYDEVIAQLTKAHPDWTTAVAVIQTLSRTQKARNVVELRGWAGKVARFLLHSPAGEPSRDGVARPGFRPQSSTVGSGQVLSHGLEAAGSTTRRVTAEPVIGQPGETTVKPQPVTDS